MDDTSRPPEFPWLNWTPDKKRLWLKQRKVKGTWARNLDSKCAEVWAISSSDAMVDKEAEPSWADWTDVQKRAFLRSNEVKGIWGRNLSAKCGEVWRQKMMDGDVIVDPMIVEAPPSPPVVMRDEAADEHNASQLVAIISTSCLTDLIEAAKQRDITNVSRLLNENLPDPNPNRKRSAEVLVEPPFVSPRATKKRKVVDSIDESVHKLLCGECIGRQTRILDLEEALTDAENELAIALDAKQKLEAKLAEMERSISAIPLQI